MLWKSKIENFNVWKSQNTEFWCLDKTNTVNSKVWKAKIPNSNIGKAEIQSSSVLEKQISRISVFAKIILKSIILIFGTAKTRSLINVWNSQIKNSIFGKGKTHLTCCRPGWLHYPVSCKNVCLQLAFPSSPAPLFQNESKCSVFDMKMIFYSHANKTHFHKKDCALGLILKVRVFETQKWPILLIARMTSTQ